MIFYKTRWYEEGGDEGWTHRVFDNERTARSDARKRALEAAEGGTSLEVRVIRVTLRAMAPRALARAMLDGYDGAEEEVAAYHFERVCLNCGHDTEHESSDEGDACGSCFHDGGLETAKVCRDADWKVRRYRTGAIERGGSVLLSRPKAPVNP